jgi:hypothetical protein
MYYIYAFYVLSIKPNAWTYISGIKLKSFLVRVRSYFQLFEYDIDDWMDYLFKAGGSMGNELYNTNIGYCNAERYKCLPNEQ